MTSEIQSEEHWARKGPVSLFLWRKRLAQPVGDVRPPIILVHGSSTSGIPSFDLQVPGQSDYSFMDWLARRGWDVWTLDHEGYGRSTITDGNSDVATGAQDLAAAHEVIAQATGSPRAYVYGMSSGALRAALFAQNAPQVVQRLVLDAFVWTGEGSPTLAKRKEGIASFRASNRRPIIYAYIESIFTRDEPGTTHPAVIAACAEAQMALGDSVPTGTYLDMTTNLPLVDPLKIAAPTLIVRGEHDGIATIEDLLEFFRQLPSGDKRFASLPGIAHVSPLGIKRHLLWNAVDEFLTAGTA
ncbi:alpha/beta hydrolase [Roseixanthobacter glucoisosaccharinicivorans]|uniref:alpha/beta hydrolase n=1 Tax=Roseixanthobacter glucoisosaccharinicivorans TaxID=3119923 RepID=UPI00372AC04A